MSYPDTYEVQMAPDRSPDDAGYGTEPYWQHAETFDDLAEARSALAHRRSLPNEPGYVPWMYRLVRRVTIDPL